MNSRGQGCALSAGAGVHGHVGVDLEHHVGMLIEEQDAERGHLLGNAAGLGDARDHAHRPHDALDGGVVGGVQGLQGRVNTLDIHSSIKYSSIIKQSTQHNKASLTLSP